jgi:ATP-dependent Clp endopeptidase proteolytic subunit ClpP
MKTPWTITAKSGGEIEILLYACIGEDGWTGEGTTAAQFADDLKAAGDVRSIHIRVNSEGGSVFQGLAIYNTLLSHGAKVTATVDGIAASIASVIICAAQTISIAKNGIVMIHNPATIAAGDAAEFTKMAAILAKVKGSMISAYKRHSPLSVAKISAMCDEETWMTAEEAVENGFAERVLSDAAIAASLDFSKFAAKFKHVPASIAARFAGAKPDVDQGVPETERTRLSQRLALLRRLPDGC